MYSLQDQNLIKPVPSLEKDWLQSNNKIRTKWFIHFIPTHKTSKFWGKLNSVLLERTAPKQPVQANFLQIQSVRESMSVSRTSLVLN